MKCTIYIQYEIFLGTWLVTFELLESHLNIAWYYEDWKDMFFYLKLFIELTEEKHVKVLQIPRLC